jgi:hypothetical protein
MTDNSNGDTTMLTKASIALAMIVAISSGTLAADNGGPSAPSATDVCSHAPGPIPSPTANQVCNRQGWFKDRYR